LTYSTYRERSEKTADIIFLNHSINFIFDLEFLTKRAHIFIQSKISRHGLV